MHSTVFFAALLALASASTIFPTARVLDAPISRTSIVGPSGSITKEDSLPIIARDVAVEGRTIVEPVASTLVESPLVVESRRLINDPLLVESRSIVDPVLTRSIVDPVLTRSVVDPVLTRSIVDPVLTRSVVDPVLTRSIVDPVLSRSIVDPVLTRSTLIDTPLIRSSAFLPEFDSRSLLDYDYRVIPRSRFYY